MRVPLASRPLAVGRHEAPTRDEQRGRSSRARLAPPPAGGANSAELCPPSHPRPRAASAIDLVVPRARRASSLAARSIPSARSDSHHAGDRGGASSAPGAPALVVVECALSADSPPDLALDRGRDVPRRGRRIDIGCALSRRRRRREAHPLQLTDQEAHRPIEHRRQIAVGDLMAQHGACALDLPMKLLVGRELHPVSIGSRRHHDRGRCRRRRRRGPSAERGRRRLVSRSANTHSVWKERRTGRHALRPRLRQPPHPRGRIRARRDLGDETLDLQLGAESGAAEQHLAVGLVQVLTQHGDRGQVKPAIRQHGEDDRKAAATPGPRRYADRPRRQTDGAASSHTRASRSRLRGRTAVACPPLPCARHAPPPPVALERAPRRGVRAEHRRTETRDGALSSSSIHNMVFYRPRQLPQAPITHSPSTKFRPAQFERLVRQRGAARDGSNPDGHSSRRLPSKSVKANRPFWRGTVKNVSPRRHGDNVSRSRPMIPAPALVEQRVTAPVDELAPWKRSGSRRKTACRVAGGLLPCCALGQRSRPRC